MYAIRSYYVQGQRSQRDDDLWVFDPRVPRWLEVPRGCNRPSARGGYYKMFVGDVAAGSLFDTHAALHIAAGVV